MNFDKLPRWAVGLIAISACALAAWAVPIVFGSFGKSVEANAAEITQVKGIAYQAKNTADDAYAMANDLKVQIADVRGTIETFRREYREDQKDDETQRRAMEERIVRAVKS